MRRLPGRDSSRGGAEEEGSLGTRNLTSGLVFPTKSDSCGKVIKMTLESQLSYSGNGATNSVSGELC